MNVTPEKVNDLVDFISYTTYQSHFDNELSLAASELNMEAWMSEFFDLDQGPEMYQLIDLTIDRIEAMEKALKER